MTRTKLQEEIIAVLEMTRENVADVRVPMKKAKFSFLMYLIDQWTDIKMEEILMNAHPVQDKDTGEIYYKMGKTVYDQLLMSNNPPPHAQVITNKNDTTRDCTGDWCKI